MSVESVVSIVRVSSRIISRYRGDLEQRQMWRSERRDRQQVRIRLELRRHSRAKMTFLDLFAATKIEIGPRPFIVESDSRGQTNVGRVELISKYANAESRVDLLLYRYGKIVIRDVSERARIEIRKWHNLFERL